MKPRKGFSPSQLAVADRFGRLPKATVPTASSTAMGIAMSMGQIFRDSEWKDRDSRGKDSTDQGDLALLGLVPGSAPVLADPSFIGVSSNVGAMRYAVQRSGMDDFEVADEVGISHSYMCKVLKGTAGLHGARLVRFMRVTKSLAPLQWLAEQMGCDVVQRDSRAAEVAALKARLNALENRRTA